MRTRILATGIALALTFPAAVSAGSQTYATPGTHNFTVPSYGTLTVTVSGAGGGGGGGATSKGFIRESGCYSNPGYEGGAGGSSSFDSIIASGGSGGAYVYGTQVYTAANGGRWDQLQAFNGSTYSTWISAPGLPGSGSGGAVLSGAGAAGGAGGSSGSFGRYYIPSLGTWGYTGASGYYGCAIEPGGSGGSGGRVTRTYGTGELPPGSSIQVTVGSGGSGGARGSEPTVSIPDTTGTFSDGSPYVIRGADAIDIYSYGDSGSPGSNGSVHITWTDPSSPSCSVEVSPSQIQQGQSATLSWSSANADLFYINNVGYVSRSGSATVFSPGDYSGTVSGPGGTATCGRVLAGNSQCSDTSKTCGADGNLRDSCGNITACQYGCSSTTNQCKDQCVSYSICDASGARAIDSCTGNTISDCASGGKACVAGACTTPSLSFESFDADWNGAAFTATGHLQVKPALTRTGQTVRLYWNVKNVSACTISGGNGDSWTDLFSGAAGKLSAPIMSSTVFSLHCDALGGATPPSVNESVPVNVAPIFQET